MEQSFKIGDTVTLTSGGHLMTVISIDPEDVIMCAWSVREDVKSKGFPRAALIKADKPKTLEECRPASLVLTHAEPTGSRSQCGQRNLVSE
jgi:uncharacterized protein YodC (DUF2158 family)